MSISRGRCYLTQGIVELVPRKSDNPAAILARMRAAALTPERRREIATLASAAPVEARKHIPKERRNEIAKKAAAARWGIAQSPAPRTKGDAQDAAAGTEGPAIPAQDAGITRDAVPPSNTQSFAPRSEGGTQDASAGRSAIPGGGGGRGSDGAAASCDVYTKGQLLRQHQLPPPAPTFDRSAYRPLGPGDCTLHSLTRGARSVVSE